MTAETAQGEITRALILDLAAAEFSHFGYSGARLQRIITATGLTKGAFYFHFPSKHAIALELVEAKYDIWPGITTEVRQNGHRGLSALQLIARRFAAQTRDDPRTTAGMRLSQEMRLMTPTSNPYARWAVTVRELLLEAAADGEIRQPDDPDQLAATIVACVFGIQYVALDTGAGASVEQQLDAFWAAFLPAIHPQP